jgi:hypothetical protein
MTTEPQWSWVEGEVTRTDDHLVLSHDDVGPEPVAFVGPPVAGVFPVEFVTLDPEVADSVRADIARELDYYLVEKGEPNPWSYAIYHSGTGANVYGRVHWGVWSAAVAQQRGEGG